MPLSDTLGVTDDTVRLELASKPVLVLEDYEVASGIFTQPSYFHMRLGAPLSAKDIFQLAPPNSDFRLSIGNTLQFEGKTDGYQTSGDGESPRVVTIMGRDLLAPVHDNEVRSEQSFKGKSAADLVKVAFDASGVKYASIDVNADASRKSRAGVAIVVLKAPPVPKTRKGQDARRAHVGETWFDVVKKDLQHSGLFLWMGPGRTVIVSRPNTDQKPLYRLTRKLAGGPQGGANGNILGDDFANDTVPRAYEWDVYGRAGGAREGRTSPSGLYTDPEMATYGFARIKSLRDRDVTSPEEAEFYARRKIAETRRAGWRLRYSVIGHTTPSTLGGLAVWTPDTMVSVDDDELGLSGNFWIESVHMIGQKDSTITWLTLHRPADLVFDRA